jgi:hypothetical protein
MQRIHCGEALLQESSGNRLISQNTENEDKKKSGRPGGR